MKKCAKCGRQNDDGNMFCDSCGNVLSGESVSTSSNNEGAYTTPQSSGSQSGYTSKPKRKITITAVVVVIIVVAAIGGVAFFIYNSFANDSANFSDDGQIHTNGLNYWEIGKDSKLRFDKESDFGIRGNYKEIVTESSSIQVNFHYRDNTEKDSSSSVTISDKTELRQSMSAIISPYKGEYNGHECYIHFTSNCIKYIDAENGLPWMIDYGEYKLVLKYCDLKPM